MQGNEEGWANILQALTNFHFYDLIVTDEQLKNVQGINVDLFNYLKESREIVLHHLLKELDPMSAFKIVLNYQTPSNQIVMDFIKNYPHLVSEVDEDGNTLLHQLVLVQNLSGIKVYLSATSAVQCTQNNIPFDIEKKNKNNQTVLQLILSGNVGEKYFLTPSKELLFISLETQQEMISAIMLHTKPSSSAQNRNSYFTQNTPLEPENPIELLKSIREDMQGLKVDMQSLTMEMQLKSNQFAKLEEKLTRIESKLNGNNVSSRGFSKI
jgi:hypothetical protein